MTDHSEAQASRLEGVLAQLETLMAQPGVEARLRDAPGENEWNVLQILGHMNEAVPFWMGHCRTLANASGDPRPFASSRNLQSPERLEAVERGARGDPAGLMGQLRENVRTAAATLRGFSAEDLAKAGIHPRRGRMTVDEVIESFVVGHSEEHVAQIKAAMAAGK